MNAIHPLWAFELNMGKLHIAFQNLQLWKILKIKKNINPTQRRKIHINYNYFFVVAKCFFLIANSHKWPCRKPDIAKGPQEHSLLCPTAFKKQKKAKEEQETNQFVHSWPWNVVGGLLVSRRRPQNALWLASSAICKTKRKNDIHTYVWP